MAHAPREDFDGAPADLDAAEASAARCALREGGVRVAFPGRVVLCETLDDVKAAQAGRIPRAAVRLDRARPE